MTVTFKVTLLRPCVERFSSSRDTIASQRVVVQREQSESQFAETLRSTFPQLQGGEIELCRVDAQRLVSPLCLEVKTPAAIIDSRQLGRSALYIKEKTTSALAPVSSSPAAHVASSHAAPVASSYAAPVASSPAAHVASSHAAPVASSYEAPVASSNAAPVASSHAPPVASSHAPPVASSYEAPVASSHAAPVAPSHAPPVAFSYEAPVASSNAAPVASSHAPPVASSYEAPVASSHAAPVAPSHAPPVAFSYEAPVASSNAAPVASSHAPPVASSYEAPVASPHSAPVASSHAPPVASPHSAPVASSPPEPVDFHSPDLLEDIYIWEEEEEDVDLKSLLTQMLSTVDFTFAPASNQINTTRGNILESAIRAFRRQRFNPGAKLDVVFRDDDGAGEGAADEGGPSREFLTLLMREIHSCEMFEGNDWQKTLSCNSRDLKRAWGALGFCPGCRNTQDSLKMCSSMKRSHFWQKTCLPCLQQKLVQLGVIEELWKAESSVFGGTGS
ncbi:hypothetical protein E1301_Tti020677 [Triplophysa tibetana]|uniref:HECT domain-containing protein n=1 Tax=Triplophysa tibetana TaxID=1572043 RepID=A0A5A9PFF9_9TELE|nr:hypothetical protein E1301_Tti020677 [Triplophysa tibetana]